ncbi:MAG TPA: response regulator [Gemmatimonadales bacterium]|nr:response regulator [Gemmatimonadales bacterium]
MSSRLLQILLVEDNPADVRLIEEAVRDAEIPGRIHAVRDGEEALDFLFRRGAHAQAVRPDLVLLDLNLPRKDGYAVLEKLKADPRLRRIPVVVLTTSASESDIRRAYDLHANAYVTKPVSLDRFLHIVRSIEDFWGSIAKLPPE